MKFNWLKNDYYTFTFLIDFSVVGNTCSVSYVSSREWFNNVYYFQQFWLSPSPFLKDYTKLVGAHRTRNADITIASIDVDAVDACSMGILSTDPPFSKVSNLAEKPGIQAAVYLAHHASTREPHLSKPHQATLVHASTGIYVFNIKALQKLLKDNPSAKHMANDLLQVAIADPTFYV